MSVSLVAFYRLFAVFFASNGFYLLSQHNAHIKLFQSIVAHLNRFIERLSAFTNPIAMLFARNIAAFIYQLHCYWGAISPLFLRHKYLLGRNVYLTAFKYVVMSGREEAKGRRKGWVRTRKRESSSVAVLPSFITLKHLVDVLLLIFCS